MNDLAPPTTNDSTLGFASATTALRNLYVARFGFAVIWAAALAATGSDLNAASGSLLVLYPLFDVAAAAYDRRTSGATRPSAPLIANAALSLAAAVGVAVAAMSGTPAVLRVWGAWAITAGIVQLVVAVQRRTLGGQWPMVLSGGISVLAGAGFVMQAGGDDPALTALAGYATLGGIFFLVSAISMHRRTTRQ